MICFKFNKSTLKNVGSELKNYHLKEKQINKKRNENIFMHFNSFAQVFFFFISLLLPII